MPESAPNSGQSRDRRRLVSQYLHDARRVAAQQKPEASAETGGGSETARVRGLVEPHLFYVVQVASEYNARDVSFEDLLAEGNLGLVEAARRFDARHGVKFLTYASWWIRKRMLEFLVREISPVRLTRYARERRRELARVTDVLRQRLGREPTEEELAQATGLEEKFLRRRRSAAPRMVSLDRTPRGEGEPTLGETLADERATDPETNAIRRHLRRLVREEVQRLDDRERMIVLNRFQLDGGEPLTFQELGDTLGLSRERARQIEQTALARLRRRLRSRIAIKTSMAARVT